MKKYTKLDNKNMAVVETQEVTRIVNLKGITDEKTQITEAHDKRIAELDEIIAEFESQPLPTSE